LVVEIAVIRRLAKAPRVIVLVATIGIAQLCRAVTYAIPDYRTGQLQISYPSPMTSTWTISNIDIGPFHASNITITGPQLLAIIVVPIIAVALWWLLGHTRFGEAVRAAATNADLARLTGVSPKLVSTAIWTIAGFLSTVSVILYATQQSSAELVAIGPETLLLGLSAALIGRMTSFPRAVGGALLVAVLYQVLVFNFPNETGLVQFVLFLIVLVLVARLSRADDAGGESFSFAPRVPPVPERLREIWWVRRMPHLLAAFALLCAILLPLVVQQSARHLTYSIILAFAIAAISVTVLTGWGGQLSLGQMAFAGIGALSGAAFSRGVTLNIGWREHRLLNGAIQPFALVLTLFLAVAALVLFAKLRSERPRGGKRTATIAGIVLLVVAAGVTSIGIVTTTPTRTPFVLSVILGAATASLLAVLVGTGALRVKGLLLAISTLAFAIAAEHYIFGRKVFTGTEGALTVTFERGSFGPFDLTHRNRG
jgi:ABC-type branched-subunit amino acid transport system permease subunit